MWLKKNVNLEGFLRILDQKFMENQILSMPTAK